MATTKDSRSILAFLGTDAEFRTWGQAIHDQLAAMPLLTQTADTGQINLTTVARPAVNTDGGYEIWRFNDALQATMPIFIKFMYGIGSVADRPRLSMRIGSSSNGSGTLGGQVLSADVGVGPSASKLTTNTLTSYVSCTASGLYICTNLDPASNSFAMFRAVERPLDYAGNPTADGINYFGVNAAACFLGNICSTGSVAATQTTRWTGEGALISGGTQLGTQNALMPIPVASNGKVRNSALKSYYHPFISELTAFTIDDEDGSNQVYLPMGDGLIGTPWSGSVNIALAMPWTL